MKINFEVLVKTKPFNPGKKEVKTSLSSTLSRPHFQNGQEADVPVVGREDVFKTISSPLTQVLLCVCCVHCPSTGLYLEEIATAIFRLTR